MYRSPIRLAGLQPGAGFDKQALSLARKKMLAELELGDGHAIVIDGTELNRQDIARLFDELANERQLAYHIAIANDDALLHFLQTGEIHSFGPGWAENDLYDDPGFRQFVSPYFAAAMSVMFQKVVSGNAGSGMITKFLRQRSFLSVADHDAAYGKITRYFLEIKNRILLCLHRLENQEGADGIQRLAAKVTKEEVEGLCTDYDLFVLNQLPEEFDDLRYSIVDALNDICVTCDHLGSPSLAYAAIAKAATVRCDSLHELVQKNKAVVYDKMQPRAYRTNTNTAPPQKEQPLRWIGLILFIFITIARLAGSSGCRDHSYNYNNSRLYDLKENSDDFRDDGTGADMKTYHSIVGALNGVTVGQEVEIGDTPDTIITLLHKEKNGVDVLAPAWKKMSLSPVDSMPKARGARSKVLIHNKSSWPAIVLYSLDEKYYGSVYILPQSQYTLRYSAGNINADVYSGNKWSDSLTTDVRVHLGQNFSRLVTLQGGFEQHSTYIKSAANALFYRSGGDKAHQKDKIIIEDDPANGTTFWAEYN
jgi:hypothetical protein